MRQGKVTLWYSVDSCGRVETLECVKVTKIYLISASGLRWRKDSIAPWFKTVDEAIQYQQDKLKSAVIDAEVSLKHCKHKLAEFLHATKGDCGSSGMSDPMEQARTEVSRLVGPYMAKEAHRLYAAALAEERVWREEAEQNLQGAISTWRERAKLLAESVASGVIQTGNIHEATAITEAANHLEEIAMRLFDDTTPTKNVRA